MEARELNWMLGAPPLDGTEPAALDSVWSADFVRDRCGGGLHAFHTDARAVILTSAGPGSRPLKVLHLSDSHIDVGRESPTFGEEGFEESASFAIELYGKGLPDSATGASSSAADVFRAQLAAAAAEGVTVVFHTGDLFNFPSLGAVELVQEAVRDSGMQFLFISGNHDWSFSSTADDLADMHPDLSPEELRALWVEEKGHLLPLYEGRDPLCWSADIAGLRFIGIDNSTYQISAAQLESFEAALDGAQGGVVLGLHIPLCLPSLQSAMRARGLVGYAESALCGDPASASDAYRPTATTEAFMRRMEVEPKLVAVLAGHIHTAQAHCVRGDWAKLAAGPLPACLGCVQYVTEASCCGGSRTISFEPPSSAFAHGFAADIGRRQRVLQAHSVPKL